LWAAGGIVLAAEAPPAEMPGLREALRSAAAQLAPALPREGKVVLLVRPDASELERYGAEMLGFSLRRQGVDVGVTVYAKMDVPAEEPPDPMAVAEPAELKRIAGPLAIAVWVPARDTGAFFIAAVYRAENGKRLAMTRQAFLLPEDLAFLAQARELPELADAEREWLDLLDRLFPSRRVEMTAEQEWAQAEGLHFFRRGLWAQAADRLGKAGEAARAVCPWRIAVALQRAGQGKQALEQVESALKLQPDSGPLYALKASLLRADAPKDAKMFLEQARLSDVPHEGFYWIAYYLVEAEQGNKEAAEQALLKGADALPREPFAQLKAARHLWRAARLPEAVTYFRRALDAGADSADVWAELATVLDACGQAQDALTACRRAFEMNPGNPAVAHHLSAMLKSQGQYDEALAVLTTAADARPDKVELPAALGDSAVALWRLDEAEAAYRRAVARDAGFLPARIGLAHVQAMRRSCARAEELLRALLAAHPECQPARIELAHALAGQGRVEDAAAVLEEVARRPDFEVRARIELAALQTRQANYEAAVHSAQVALAPGPNADGYAALARAFIGLKKWEEAEIAVKTGLEASPLSEALCLASAELAVARGQYDVALEAADKVIKGNSYLPDALVLAGRACLQLDQPDKCATFWTRAAELDRWDATLQWDLAELYRTRLSNPAGGIRHYERHIELGGPHKGEAAQILQELRGNQDKPQDNK
jgi:tetratricopeptide (TPR) repeat protein